MDSNISKDKFIGILLGFRSDDHKNVGEVIQNLDDYMAQNEYDIQMELIWHTFRTIRDACSTSTFEQVCNTAAPIFKLLKTTNWGLVELYVLAMTVVYTPHYTVSEDFKSEAFDILDDDFHDHKEHDKIKRGIYVNLSMRLLRAKYFDGENPQEVKDLFDRCVSSALALYDKINNSLFKTVLLIRQALFYGQCGKIPGLIHTLDKSKNKAFVDVVKDDLIEFLYHMGDSITTPLLNILIGHQIRKRRTELGISTLDLADAIGISQTALNAYERGEKGVGGPRLCKIASVLGVDMAYFYGNTRGNNTNTISDMKLHTLVQLVTPLSEEQKDFILYHVRGYIKHQKEEALKYKKAGNHEQ